jgi:hypothetical protein
MSGAVERRTPQKRVDCKTAYLDETHPLHRKAVYNSPCRL